MIKKFLFSFLCVILVVNLYSMQKDASSSCSEFNENMPSLIAFSDEEDLPRHRLTLEDNEQMAVSYSPVFQKYIRHLQGPVVAKLSINSCCLKELSKDEKNFIKVCFGRDIFTKQSLYFSVTYEIESIYKGEGEKSILPIEFPSNHGQVLSYPSHFLYTDLKHENEGDKLSITLYPFVANFMPILMVYTCVQKNVKGGKKITFKEKIKECLADCRERHPEISSKEWQELLK